jgi:hypothetical protein
MRVGGGSAFTRISSKETPRAMQIITNPDIAQPTGNAEIDSMIHRLLDAQQDINFEANSRMSQSLCDASALIDDCERLLRKLGGQKE